MNPTALLVATATTWLGTARMPRNLVKAGWTVALLAPRDSLAEASRFIRKIGHLPAGATQLQWVHAFAGMVRATAPRLVFPCDDTAFRLMQALAVSPPEDMQPVPRLQLAALINDSLGNAVHYRASVDKTLLCQAAEAAGVRVPPYTVIDDPVGAAAFATQHGWPVVLKRGHSSAGDGVAICADEDSVAREYARLLAGDSVNLGDGPGRRMLIQAHVPGRTQYYAGTAWRGEMLCGYAVEKIEGEPRGPASVVRYFHSAELEASAMRLAAAFGASGIFAPEYIIHEQTGDAYLVEINRRITPGTHRGAYIDVDSAAALLSAVEGSPRTTRSRLDDREEHIFVSFPHEWLRDPASPYLREHPVDVPWDEPELIEAMLAMGRDR
jgi:hypothetical protein